MKNIFILVLLFISCSNSTHKTSKTENYESFKKNIDYKNDTLKKLKTESNYIKQDSIYKFLTLIKDTVIPPKNCNPFDSLKFNKAVAYEYFGEHDNRFTFDTHKLFFPNIEHQKALTQKQVDDICKLLSNKSTYGGGTAACFDPHLCICFFNKNKCVMEISVCLSCNFLESTVDIPAEKSYPVKYEEGIGYRKGFSKKAQNKLKSFCSSLGYQTYDFPF